MYKQARPKNVLHLNCMYCLEHSIYASIRSLQSLGGYRALFLIYRMLDIGYCPNCRGKGCIVIRNWLCMTWAAWQSRTLGGTILAWVTASNRNRQHKIDGHIFRSRKGSLARYRLCTRHGCLSRFGRLVISHFLAVNANNSAVIW